MATIVINGRTYSGNRIEMRNGQMWVDGRAEGEVSGIVEVRITEGVLGELKTDSSVTCGEVRGNVSAAGSVNCDSVGGNVSAGGSVNCDAVGGNVMAGGSVLRG